MAVDEVSKKELRSFALASRKSVENKLEKELIITLKLLENEKIKTSQNILIYMSTSNEVNTKYLIDKLLKLNKNIYIPKVIEHDIKFYKYNLNDKLVTGKFNILEPTSTEELSKFNDSVIIVPGLMFDKLGNRLGYGGGYYDRFLENKSIYKIGICFKEFLIDNLPSNFHDIKMDLVITE